MCYFGKGALWHENGTGLHVKAEPGQPVSPCWLCAGPCNRSDPTQLLKYWDIIARQYIVNMGWAFLCMWEKMLLGSVIGFKSAVSHVRGTLKAHIKCANDSGDKTLTVWVIADIMCNDISMGDRGAGDGALAVSVWCLGMLEWKTALNSSVHTTSELSWVLIDMSLFRLTRFWSGMRQAEAIRISTLCESNLKVPLRRLSFCSLKSGGTSGGWDHTTAETETLTGAVKDFFLPAFAF